VNIFWHIMTMQSPILPLPLCPWNILPLYRKWEACSYKALCCPSIILRLSLQTCHSAFIVNTLHWRCCITNLRLGKLLLKQTKSIPNCFRLSALWFILQQGWVGMAWWGWGANEEPGRTHLEAPPPPLPCGEPTPGLASLSLLVTSNSSLPL
jgi:hypothetical protein